MRQSFSSKREVIGERIRIDKRRVVILYNTLLIIVYVIDFTKAFVLDR
jgi:hypothetical protein